MPQQQQNSKWLFWYRGQGHKVIGFGVNEAVSLVEYLPMHAKINSLLLRFRKYGQILRFLIQNFKFFLLQTDKHLRRQDKDYMPANSFPGA